MSQTRQPDDREAHGRPASAWTAPRSFRGDPRSRRARRVVLLLILLWIVGLFDLTYTILAQHIGNFHEANPVARLLLGNSAALTVFKVTSLIVASAILLALRRRLVAEIACWLACGIYVALAFMWLVYYARYR